MTESATPMLSARGVKTYYGNIIALKGVDIDVRQGEIVTMIGANGAGEDADAIESTRKAKGARCTDC